MVATLCSAGAATLSGSAGKMPARVIEHSHCHQRGTYHYHQQRWPGATPVLVATLLFCAGTFILFQVLVTRATVNHRKTLLQWAASGVSGGRGGEGAESGGGKSSSNGWGSARVRQLLGEASSDGGGGGGNGGNGGNAGIPDGGGSAHAERVLKSLKALDSELRALVYQPIPSVEKFTGDLMIRWERLHNGSSGGIGGGGRGATSPSSASSPRPLPACPVKLEPRHKTLRNFYSSNSSTNSEGHWQPAWLHDPFPGGTHMPADCQATKSVLIVVPYRHRAKHLVLLLSYLHPILQGQKLSYTVVVGEQSGNETFNKAKLMNAAFLESMKLRKFDCVIFHDVDLLPTNPFVPYNCPVYPRHISVSIDKFGYSLPYKQLVGGVLAMPVRYFLRVNGYSNLFWGWGGEDDDMETRIRTAGLLVTRPHPKLARYRMIRHRSRKEILGEVMYKLLYLSSKRYRLDGLNSLNYSLVAMREMPLFTHFLINLGPPPKSASFY